MRIGLHTSPGVAHSSPEVVHTSPGVVHTSPGVVHTSPGVVHTSPGVVHTSPGVVLPYQGARRNSRRVVKGSSRSIRLGRRSESIMLKKAANCLENTLFARAYIYVYYFPKKVFTPSHRARFLLNFIGSRCEGFVIQAFTRTVNACEERKGQAFTKENR